MPAPATASCRCVIVTVLRCAMLLGILNPPPPPRGEYFTKPYPSSVFRDLHSIPDFSPMMALFPLTNPTRPQSL